ncbi:MAG TPA: hypothetical protein VE326_10955 [Candidatus Binatia bacterium]|nr:hypothetical protein [Candidatus Binatia bacterium]
MKARPLPLLVVLVLPLCAFALSCFNVSSAGAAGDPMRLVGSLVPRENGMYGAVVVNAALGVAYLGSLQATHGVSVIDMRDRAHPVLTTELAPPPPNDSNNQSTSYDVDLVGRYLLVAHHQEFGRNAFAGVSVYDISADPFHPTLLRRIAVPASCGLESAELDPEVESGRPYAYCNAHCIVDGGMYTVNILTGQVLSRYVSPEGLNCPPFPCVDENLPHEAFVQRHPRSGKVLIYIGFWDSGLRIVDVTTPTNPIEVGSFDYGTGTPYQNAHGAVASPSGNWIYVGDELAENTTGGVHILDGHACDGTQYCTPPQVGFWHADGHVVQNPDDHSFPTYFRFDAHNMDPHGENALLLGNYALGVRLVDVTTKSDPEEISFYLPTSSPDVLDRQLYMGRRTWVALFGSDGLIYASDINYGFFILALNPNTVLPSGSASFARGAHKDTLQGLRVHSSVAGAHSFTFSTRSGGPVSLEVFDAAGRSVATARQPYASPGSHSIEWTGLLPGSRRAPSGIYFARLQTGDGVQLAKVAHFAP